MGRCVALKYCYVGTFAKNELVVNGIMAHMQKKNSSQGRWQVCIMRPTIIEDCYELVSSTYQLVGTKGKSIFH